MALIHFALTLFMSAFILFLVQPIIGKLILPKLGGTPQVWNTCMVFFQMVLLLGYFYTHFVSTKLKPRAQIIMHGLIIVLPFIVFLSFPAYFFIKEGWTPPLGSNPIFSTLGVLATVIGIPFFVVSTTAPLLQKWFGLTGHPAAKDPYFLYGASNLGSMLSLLVYPILIEPYTALKTQTIIWQVGYAILAALVFLCVVMIFKPSGEKDASKKEANQPETSPMPVTGEAAVTAIQSKPSNRLADSSKGDSTGEVVDGWRKLRWVLLAAVPSSMMLGVTSHITTDLSPVPLFWLVPLAFYLLSFILVFARWPFVWIEAPHNLMLLLQPIGIVLMILFDMLHFENAAIIGNLLGFVLTVMVCHGELAKDRPSTKFLTDFYLMMSVGGVVGGMLNALIAPLFPFVFELNLAIIAACFLRPNLPYGHWLDSIVGSFADKPATQPVRGKGKAQVAAVAAEPEIATSPGYGLDVAVGAAVFAAAFLVNALFNKPGGSDSSTYYWFILGSSLVCMVAALFFARSMRFGLAVAGIILAFEGYSFFSETGRLYSSRSYFGVIRVRQSGERLELPNKTPEMYQYTTLMHGRINHGQNYVKNTDDPTKDYSRLATTYYHRKGPVGIAMEKFNWFPNPTNNNSFNADARLPAGLVAQSALGGFGVGLPVGNLVEVWTEPPYATIGLGTGTMASYARPFQHAHFYEIDDQIRKLSLPEDGGQPYFTYLKDAKDRGAEIQVHMGDARQRMDLKYPKYEDREKHPKDLPIGGPEKFYHLMVVDAFSSDAIPAHLLTKEAFEMYFKHLTPDGVLCVHTSNRYVDLPRVVADVAESLGYVAYRGHDNAPDHKREPVTDKGHFTSEWVMVARKATEDIKGDKAAKPGESRTKTERQYLSHLTEPRGYREAVRKNPEMRYEPYWEIPRTYDGKYLWTDDYYNLLNILRWFNKRES